MSTYLIHEVGAEKDAAFFDAGNEYHAVAQAAGCSFADICLPIWTTYRTVRWFINPYTGERQPYLHHRPIEAMCFMPLDNSGRQWIVKPVDER
jgi:hypothetical protein